MSRRLQALVASGVAIFLLGLTWRLMGDWERAAGDWLFRVVGADGERLWHAPGVALDALIGGFDLWARPAATVRLMLLVVLAVGIVGITLSACRVDGWSLWTASATSGAMAFLPWCGDDAGELAGNGVLAVPLLLLPALLVKRRGVFWACSLLCGAASGCMIGQHWPFGAALLLVALARAGRMAAIGGGLWCVGSFGCAAVLARQEGVIPSSSTWWVDIGQHALLGGLDLAQVLFGGIAVVWLVGRLGRRGVWLAHAGSVVLLAAALIVTSLGVRRSTVRHRVMVRDRGSLEVVTGRVPLRHVDLLFLNLPAHVRPWLSGIVMTSDQLVNWWSAETLATATQLYVPARWRQFPEQTPVLRWTKTGFEDTSWGECLAGLDALPLAGAASEFADSPAQMLRLQRWPSSSSAGVDFEDVSDGVRVRVTANADVRIAVAAVGNRLRRASEPGFMIGSLSDGWFDGPRSDMKPRAVRLERQSGTPVEQVGWANGYGPVLLFRARDGKVRAEVVVASP
ncbi:MAG: hypothetical protein QGG14_02300 [Planctomycetota bacterium]|jgi:hypothetical protein|nr:hypothetical protein [Planctomycetota bacterium]